MKMLALLALFTTTAAHAHAPQLVTSFQTTFQGNQTGLVELYDKGDCCRLVLQVTLGRQKFVYKDIVITGQSVDRDESGFTISQHDHQETERLYRDEKKALHVDLVGGALAVTAEEESRRAHQVAEEDSDTGDQINYVTGALSYHRLGRSEDGVNVPRAQLPKTCTPPALESYKYFTAPLCALDAMK